jgi:hypothetical protein
VVSTGIKFMSSFMKTGQLYSEYYIILLLLKTFFRSLKDTHRHGDLISLFFSSYESERLCNFEAVSRYCLECIYIICW